MHRIFWIVAACVAAYAASGYAQGLLDTGEPQPKPREAA